MRGGFPSDDSELNELTKGMELADLVEMAFLMEQMVLRIRNKCARLNGIWPIDPPEFESRN